MRFGTARDSALRWVVREKENIRGGSPDVPYESKNNKHPVNLEQYRQYPRAEDVWCFRGVCLLLLILAGRMCLLLLDIGRGHCRSDPTDFSWRVALPVS